MYDVHPPSGTAAPRVYLWLQSLLWCSCSPVALLLTIQRGSEELQRNVPPQNSFSVVHFWNFMVVVGVSEIVLVLLCCF